MDTQVRTKYGNKVTMVDGERFDSQREAARWRELQLLARAGLVRDLRRQVPYDLDVRGHHIARYVADFVYLEANVERTEWKQVVEDSKGFPTPAYVLKRKLMRAIHGIEIRET